MAIQNLGYWDTISAVTIECNGDDSQPTYNLVDGVQTQIVYVEPKITAGAKYPPGVVKDVTSVYGSRTVGEVTYDNLFLNHTVNYQTNLWRVGFSYANKPGNTNVSLRFAQSYPVQGWLNVCTVELPYASTSGIYYQVLLPTYPDETSSYPVGTGGWQLITLAKGGNLTLTIDWVVRST